MGSSFSSVFVLAFVSITTLNACGSDNDDAPSGSSGAGGRPSSAGVSGGKAPSGQASGGSSSAGATSSSASAPSSSPEDGPPAGYADGHADIPNEAVAEDVSSPTTVIGDGSPESCTGSAFVAAVAKGGVITFDCGPEPVTLTLEATAKVFNDKGTKLVIDGGNLVTLSGAGKTRILYMATCDKAQVYPPGPGDCNTNPGVQLVVQNLTFVDGSAKGIPDGENNAGGGGAIYAQGGSLKVVNCRFFNNVCEDLGSDVGGGAIRKLDYLTAAGAGPKRPAWVISSTFGGKPGLGNACANGGALSSIGVSWNILNSVLSENEAVGHGQNAGDGGNGGAIYNDGNEIVLNIRGSLLENNQANEGGSAVFFVSNNETGTLTLTNSLARNNPRGTFETPDLPGFFVKAKQPAIVVNSQILR